MQVDPVFEGLSGGAASLVKYNPLSNMSSAETWHFLRAMVPPPPPPPPACELRPRGAHGSSTAATRVGTERRQLCLEAPAICCKAEPCRSRVRAERTGVLAQGVPTNEMHMHGYVSIGCEPCTRPVLPNQHEREGRWWWEVCCAPACQGLLLAANLLSCLAGRRPG